LFNIDRQASEELSRLFLVSSFERELDGVSTGPIFSEFWSMRFEKRSTLSNVELVFFKHGFMFA
jgi:hypothetical protein